MTQEEKAHRYDEAIIKVKALYGQPLVDNILLETIFPELAESEDERIRKEIITFIATTPKQRNSHSKWLAWLEKQGEQKECTPLFRVGDTLKKKGKEYTFIVDRIQGGFYHCDHNKGAFFPIEKQDSWELVEQKPAWSEEDEKMLVDAYVMLDWYKGNNWWTARRIKDWLKSLKERIGG